MVLKYLYNLIAVVVGVTLLCMPLPFVTRAQVLAGKTEQETWKTEFTIDVGSNQTIIISQGLKAQLEKTIAFVGSGAVQVTSANVQVTPKEVSWSENKAQYSAPGAAMAVQLNWQVSADAPDGAYGEICIQFPHPGVSYHSGGYQKYSDGRCVVRQVVAHRGAVSLWTAQFVQALGAGLPWGILVQSIYWGFVLAKERRDRIAALPPHAPGALPHTFYSNPTAEWFIWTLLFGMFAFVASLIATFSVVDRFMSTGMYGFVLGAVGVGAVVALISAAIARSRALTLQLDTDVFSYARGRGPANWNEVRWDALPSVLVKSQVYKGNRTEWVELVLPDKKKLKISSTMVDYPALRDMMMSLAARRAGK